MVSFLFLFLRVILSRMKFLEKKPVHIAILVLGAAFLLIDAFHGNIWFDESYSVGIAKYSFTDIWSIGAGDVHPVLFYWALHIIYLLIGENWLAYRLFAVAGAVALGALGLSHIRRDFGEKVGVLFTFLALFTPYVSQMSSEIRMYTWVSFTVMVCAIYGYRIVATLCNTVPKNIAKAAASRKKTWAGVPCIWWIIFALSSLASAYLQYYGALFVFMVNLILLIFLIVKRNFKAIAIFAILAVLQVGLYVPWLVVAFGGQVGQVSGTYWARLSFPTTIIEIVTYPLLTSQMSFAIKGDQGVVIQVLSNASYALFVVCAICAVVAWIKCSKNKSAGAQVKNAQVKNTQKENTQAKKTTVEGTQTKSTQTKNATLKNTQTENTEAKNTHTKESGIKDVFSRLKFHLQKARAFLKIWARKDAVSPFLGAFAVYLGVLLIATGVSVFLQTDILYYRYLYVGIGPFLFCMAGILAALRPKWLSCVMCASVLFVAAINMACLVHDDYSDENKEPLRAFEEISQKTDLILSSDIGFMGVTAVTYPDVPQVYMDWQKGGWNIAYKAYAPAMTSVKKWEKVLKDYHGQFAVIAQSSKGDVPRSVTDLDRKDNISVIDQYIYYRPYERTFFTVALLEKE